MEKKLRLGLIFGGRSPEHEVSILSAKRVYHALDTTKYDIVLLGVTRDSNWHLISHEMADSVFESLKIEGHPLSKPLASLIDVALPVTHGPNGEDGALQGMMQFYHIPCVGAGVLASSLCMDKVMTKHVLEHAGLPITPYTVISQESVPSFSALKEEFGAPFFIKPTNLGSSIGVHPVSNEEEYTQALDDAFLYDSRVLIEKKVVGRELECGIIGNQVLEVSECGEVLTQDALYTYEDKYTQDSGFKLEVPARLTPSQKKKAQDLSKRTYTALSCTGMARIDLFLTEDNEVLVNEVNTLPGLTATSGFPTLFEKSNKSLSNLLDQVIALSIQARDEKEKLQPFAKKGILLTKTCV